LFYQHIRAKRIAYVEASAVAAENKPLDIIRNKVFRCFASQFSGKKRCF
jgi:hypothetical protein